jgi:hypothetical protein
MSVVPTGLRVLIRCSHPPRHADGLHAAVFALQEAEAVNSAEDEQGGRRPRARWRPASRRAISAASVAVGAAVGGYLAGGRLADLGRLLHLFPDGALFLLIITAGVVAVVLGWRVVVYLERRDRHHREIISSMQDQEGVYQKYEGSTDTYVRWPMPAVTQSEEGTRQAGHSRPSQAVKSGHGDVVPLDRHPQPVSGTAAQDGLSDPAPGSPLGHEHSA